jgi:hypothetical protein
MRLTMLPAVAALAFAAGLAHADGALATRIEMRLVETAGATDPDTAAPTRGRFRLDFSARTAAAQASSFGIHAGELSFELVLDRGRFAGDVLAAAGAVRVRVRSRGHALRATVTGRAARGGTVLGVRCFQQVTYDGVPGTFHGLVAANADVDGTAVPLVVGWSGWSSAHDRRNDGVFRYDLGLAAAAVVPVEHATLPLVVLAPPRPGAPWNGRLAGISFATGAPPSLSYTTAVGRTRRIDTSDETSSDYGDAETQSPGVTLLLLAEGAVFERGFDVAVQAPPGQQWVTVRADGPHGGRAEATREFHPPAALPPTQLDAEFHVLEIRPGGVLWSWGENIAGEIGDGTYERSPATPEPLDVPHQVVSVGAGSLYSIAADARGDVWVWGDIGDLDVERGGFTDTYQPRPVHVDGIANAVQVSAGYEDALVLDASGAVVEWSYDLPHLTRFDGLPPMVSVADGDGGTLALDADGVAWDLGAKDAAGKPSPAAIAGAPRVTAIAAGDSEALLLDESGAVWRRTPDGARVAVGLPAAAIAVSAGYDYSLSLLADGTVWAWGTGQETATSVTAVRVRNLDGITSVVAGTGDKSFAVDSDGFVWMWDSFDLNGGDERPVLAPREFHPGGIPPATATLDKRSRRAR